MTRPVLTGSGPEVTIVGGGLAGCEAALQLARFGHRVRLVEMRPDTPTPVHESNQLAAIVCSNSLKSTAVSTGSGLLKAELDLMGCRLLECARGSAVPAGSALAVDRNQFSTLVEEQLAESPMIDVCREEITKLDELDNHCWLVATGPMSSPAMIQELGKLTGQPELHFYDAIAPTVTLESLDLDQLYRAARYDKGEADYLNCPLDEAAYEILYEDLRSAEKATLHELDTDELFAGCQPIEEIAASGQKSLAFGPLRPVGLRDPRTGQRPHAVVQLRQENSAGTLYGLVGFQTQLKHSEQKRIFRRLPGLENAEFVRLGQLHRNFYVDSPRCLARDYSLLARRDVFMAGQITGVEGYVESMASGLLTAWQISARLQQRTLAPLPVQSMLGALLGQYLFDKTSSRFSPMNSNFGLVPDLVQKVRGKRERKLAKSSRALDALGVWLDDNRLGES